MLSKESIKRLRMVKEAILANPQYYRQEEWISAIEPCGTTCCIAGWADYLFNGKKAHEARAKAELSNYMVSWEYVAAKALGLDYCQAHTLTYPGSGWPVPFCTAYTRAKTPKQRAKVAARRIEHFIKTGGAE
jgi:hypothetical protein